MSTKVIARGIVGSLRLVGVTAAVAAGIAGFAPIQTDVATTDLAVVSAKGHAPQLPERACDNAKKHVSSAARPFLSCRVIDGSGPIDGGLIFS